MHIIESQSKPPFSLKRLPIPKNLAVILTILFIFTTTITFAFLGKTNPTGTFLSPLPQTQQAQAIPSNPTPSQAAQSPQQLILTAQAYLEKAISISQNQAQTQQDKDKIIKNLNTGLQYANQAVQTNPQNPQSYLVRARILASSQTIRQDALQLAQKDLETAQTLSGGQKVQLPTDINLLDYTPTQQAQKDQDLIIAAPQESTTSSAQTDSNVNKITATFPQGQTKTTINNPQIKPNSYIYLISPNQSSLYLHSKTAGRATIATQNAPSKDLQFQYWIVQP